jgi:hypothetical protein
MSREIIRQKAEIRRQAARIELQSMRAHVAAKRREAAAAEAAEREWTKSRKAERKARLTDLRRRISTARGKKALERRRRLQAIHEKRKDFVQWWAAVRAERIRRLEEIRQLRSELKGWDVDFSERHRRSTAEITDQAAKELERFDRETMSEDEALKRAIERARAELRTDEYDLKTWTGNRRRERTPPKPLRRTSAETKAELADEVENNLTSAEEFAWWRANRAPILRQAKAMGITAGDGIAELVREAAEADPDRALEYLQRDADAWVEAEARKAGFAA